MLTSHRLLWVHIKSSIISYRYRPHHLPICGLLFLSMLPIGRFFLNGDQVLVVRRLWARLCIMEMEKKPDTTVGQLSTTFGWDQRTVVSYILGIGYPAILSTWVPLDLCMWFGRGVEDRYLGIVAFSSTQEELSQRYCHWKMGPFCCPCHWLPWRITYKRA